METNRILLIDDHAMFRSGLRMVLGEHMQGAEIFEAGSLNSAMRDAPDQVDVILLDINLPGLNGLDGIVFLKRKWPLVPVIVLSAQDGPDTVRVAHERGAVCFISKADTADNIVSLLFQVLQGEYPAPETELGEIADVPLIIPLRLTPRQCEVLELLHQGKPNKLIARQLSLSENTVRNHVQAIFNFLQVASRSEAIFEARRRGLIG